VDFKSWRSQNVHFSFFFSISDLIFHEFNKVFFTFRFKFQNGLFFNWVHDFGPENKSTDALCLPMSLRHQPPGSSS